MSKDTEENYNIILKSLSKNGVRKERHVAYILATTFHEVGGRLQPVREGFAKTNEEAVQIVTKMYERGRISKNYALPNSDGNSYYGRGYVQLTWEENYKKIGKLINVPLHSNPDLALKPEVASEILVEGMMNGWFSGAKLTQYINDNKKDYVNARRVVNILDKAELIANYAENFEICIDTCIFADKVFELKNPFMKGNEIKIIQNYLNIKPDGVFGPNTEKAVRLFQEKNCITVDGKIKNQELKLLGLI